MVSMKHVIFAALVSIAVILGAAVVSLSVVLHQKRSEIEHKTRQRSAALETEEADKKEGMGREDETSGLHKEARTERRLWLTAAGLDGDIGAFRQSRYVPDTTSLESSRLRAEAHLAEALRRIPFESMHQTVDSSIDDDDERMTVFSFGGISVALAAASPSAQHHSPPKKGNALPPRLRHVDTAASSHVNDHSGRYGTALNGGDSQSIGTLGSVWNFFFSSSLRRSNSRGQSHGGGNGMALWSTLGKAYTYMAGPSSGPNDPLSESFTNTRDASHDTQLQTPQTQISEPSDETSKSQPSSNRTAPADNLHPALQEDQRAMYHLMQASEMGNSYAQQIVANSLVSGILPVQRYSADVPAFQRLYVPNAMSGGGDQLARAIVLWHMSAMQGNIESAMALGYRHLHSATGGTFQWNNLITESEFASQRRRNKSTQHQSRSSDPSDYYGVYGTCESALAYYEAAANALMDDLEASDLRGKVTPAVDHHQLAEIHVNGGATSELADHNKPPESEELLQYYDNLSTGPNPSSGAAFTLGKLYHYGYNGVRQDMKTALKYYEIAAQRKHWDAASQVGRFHFWGIGLLNNERNLTKAHDYFMMAAPGGLKGCKLRKAALERKAKTPGGHKDNWEDEDDEDDDDDDADEDDEEEDDDASYAYGRRLSEDAKQCNHHALNGLGLLHLYGIPGLVEQDKIVAKDYFGMASQLGNADAKYNLAMIRLGWMKERRTITHTVIEEDDDSLADDGDQNFDDDDDEVNDDDDDDDDDAITGVSATKTGNAKVAGTGKSSADSATKKSSAVSTKEKKSSVQKPKSWDRIVEDRVVKSDYAAALKLLTEAGDHIQAKHRLAQLHSRGVYVEEARSRHETVEAVPKSCKKALKLFKEITDVGTTTSKRTRTAYRQYLSGDVESSLRNYLASAETGQHTSQANAAFLLEQGHCLGLSRDDCMQASVRLWKAAAKQGDEEACLRVGDFYYYGRLRSNDNDSEIHFKMHDLMRYFAFPEELVMIAKRVVVKSVRQFVTGMIVDTTSENQLQESQEHKTEEDAEGVTDDEHLAMAAHYYRKAAEDLKSARGHFNLGFMYEWGLGLAQDFPLAKRHYDQAAVARGGGGQAIIAVKLALMCRAIHEQIVKLGHFVDSNWRQQDEMVDQNDGDEANEKNEVEEPLERTDVIMSHLLHWDSLGIAILILILLRLIQFRLNRH